MLLLKTVAPWLLLVFLGQQVSLSSGARNKNRGAAETTAAQRSASKPDASGQHGKFPADKMQCTWRARDVEETVRVTVTCEDPVARIKGGITDLQCNYNARPHACPAYLSTNRRFWKQVGRAFKRLKGKACYDERALVKTSVCRSASRDAHFKLDISSSVVSAQSGGEEDTTITDTDTPVTDTDTTITAAPRNCTGRTNHWKTAEETCTGSWASVCNFFMSILQYDDC